MRFVSGAILSVSVLVGFLAAAPVRREVVRRQLTSEQLFDGLTGESVADRVLAAADHRTRPSVADGVVRGEQQPMLGGGQPHQPEPHQGAAAQVEGAGHLLIAALLQADGWPEDSVAETASAALALIEGALLLARVSWQLSHLANARRAAVSLLAMPPVPGRLT